MKAKTVTPALLDFWLKNSMNVLFIGRRGVGKTAIVKDTFERNGLKWKYFSAATMDPFVDFVGIPRAVVRDGREVLEFVMSPDFTDDAVEALFFDEFNRSHKKVRDAVMELIQFKSINGRKFHNLKVVWAAINPVEEDDEKYQVEELDPAILDRFHTHVNVPYKPDRKFFEEHYAKEGQAAVDWWTEQPENVQKLISPRRLEYALKAALAGNVGFVFPDKVNSVGFLKAIKSGSLTEVITDFVKKNDTATASKWLESPNNLDALLPMLKGNKSWWSFYLPIIPQEHLTKTLSTNRTILKYLVDLESTTPAFTKALDNFESSTGDRKLLKWLGANRSVTGSGQYSNWLKQMKISPNTYDRMKIVVDLHKNVAQIPKSEYPTVQEILKTFVIRAQRYTLISRSRIMMGGLAPMNVCKKILKVVGMTDELKSAITLKGIRV